MKILCLCSGGKVRSVAASFYIQDALGHECLAAGVDKASPETLDYLCRWADLVLYAEEPLKKFVPEVHHSKTRLLPVGPDVWHYLPPTSLIQKIKEAAEAAGIKKA